MKSQLATLLNKFELVVDIQDHRQVTGLMMKNCFMGSEAVDAMIDAGMVKTRNEGVRAAKRLQKELRVFRQVRGIQKPFQDKNLLYRLTIPESIKEGDEIYKIIDQCPDHWNEDYSKLELKDKAQVFFRLAQVADRIFRFKKYRSCFVGSEIVDRMVYCGLAATREDAVLLGIELARERKLFVHVNRKNWFADDSSLYAFSDGVLSVIYEVHLAEKCLNANHDKIFAVAATLQAPSPLEKKLSPLERIVNLPRKAQRNTLLVDNTSDDDDNSILSAPEMSQCNSLEESKCSIQLSNSFDTLGDLVVKYGWGNESVLTMKLDENYGNPGSRHMLLGGEVEDDLDAGPIQFTKKSPPSPPVYGKSNVVAADKSLISEPEFEHSLEESYDESPRTVMEYTMPALYQNGKKTTYPEEMHSLSLSPIRSPHNLPARNVSTIFVDNSASEDDDMTQVTLDQALTTASPEQDIGRLLCPQQTSNDPDASPFRRQSPKASAVMNKGSPHQQEQKRLHSNIQRSVSHHTSTENSNGSFESSNKHRIAEILRRDLWRAKDDSAVAFALEELCQLMAVSTSNMAYVVHCGGVAALMRKMEEYTSTESIQFYGCEALSALASLDLDTQSAITEMDGIPLVVRSMQSHTTSSRLQEAGRTALGAICYRCQV